MRKNRWLLLGLLLACIVGVVLLVLALLPPRPGVTKKNFDRIKVGMARAEVEAIFGGPPKGLFGMHFQDDASGDSAIITFDDNDLVASMLWGPNLHDDRTLWEKLLDRLPWREKPPPPPRRT